MLFPQKSQTTQKIWKYSWRILSQQQPWPTRGQPHEELWSINGVPECSVLGGNGRVLYPCLKQSLEVGQLRRMCPWLSAGDTNPEGANMVSSPSLDLDLSSPSPCAPQQCTGNVFSHQWFLTVKRYFIILITLIYEYPIVEHWVVMNFLLV